MEENNYIKGFFEGYHFFCGKINKKFIKTIPKTLKEKQTEGETEKMLRMLILQLSSGRAIISRL